ncbi:MAG: hypothetical protein M1836_004622 [Candelina mexicana]|nr:MAG: hypothetical protein M1836_004622 [Candelina mexicana]
MRALSISSDTLLSTLTLTLTTLLTIPYLTTAQAPQPPIIPNTLPACSTQCTPLLNAQNVCIPPAAQVTNEQTYKSCFCNSAYLTPLQNGVTGLCDQVCDAGSLTAIRNWFLGFCASGGGAATTAGVANKPSVTETVPSATSRDTALPATATVGSSTTDNGAAATNGPQGGWWSTHWNWVLFLILLAVLGALFSVGGVMIKRRYKRRQAAKAHPHNPYGPSNNNNNNSNNVEAGLGNTAQGRSTTQEMLQSGEWGPLAPSHHTGFREGYGKEKGVRFEEAVAASGDGGDAVIEVRKDESKRTNKVRKKGLFGGRKV